MKIKDVFSGGGNLLIGAAVVIAAPVVVSVVSAAARPLTKSTIKGGLLAYNKVRELVAEAREGLEDLTAEAKSEIMEMERVQSRPHPEAQKKAAAGKKEG